jgi:hypothetical protein
MPSLPLGDSPKEGEHTSQSFESPFGRKSGGSPGCRAVPVRPAEIDDPGVCDLLCNEVLRLS